MMAVEEAQKLSTAEEAPPNPNPTVGDDNEVEEGEIVGEDEAGSKKLAYEPHALEHRWTFWFDRFDSQSAKSNKQATWGNSMRSIYTFSTVEEFWGVYNNIHHPSKLPAPADFHCFKYNIEPKWEDPVCANGGKWTLTFQKDKCDISWLYTLLAMIGEQFDYGDEICGAVVSVRGRGRQDKIALWTKNASNEAAQLSIGRQWKEFLSYNESMGFIFHEDAKIHDKSAKNRYTI